MIGTTEPSNRGMTFEQKRRGYDVLFCSNPRNATSLSLIEEVEFNQQQALVRVNRGLLGEGSLVPDYFLQWANGADNPEAFYAFLAFFDHQLISNLLEASYPETETDIFGGWRMSQRSYVKMMGLSSPTTLQWLLQLHFPELPVQVKRLRIQGQDKGHTQVAGNSKLNGRNVIGWDYAGQAAGFHIRLVADEEVEEKGRSQAQWVRERFDNEILPILRPYQLHILVELVLHSYHRHFGAPLDDVQTAGKLGTDRIYGKDGSPHIIRLFSGNVGGGS